MNTPSTHWREALAIALKRALRIDCDAGQAAQVLRSVSGRHLPALEASIRRQYWHAELPGFAWPLRALPDEQDIDAQLFCAGCHHNGRIRERALRLMRERHARLAVALALIRCDDWVHQVRHCAEETLRNIIAAEPAILFAHLDLLIALRARLRMQNGVWRTLIEPALLAPTLADALWNALDGTHSSLFVCDLILRADPTQAEALALRTIQHRDSAVACWGLRELLPRSRPSLSDDLIARALRHPNASLRAYALRAHARTDDGSDRVRLHEHLFDPSISVRNVAAYATRALGFEPRDAWRDALDRGVEPHNRYALIALSDSTENQDLARIAPWLKHPISELRCAALRAAVRAGIDNPTAQLRDALTSPSSKVVALALKLGVTVSGFMTRETLSNAFTAAANFIVRRRIINATRQLGRWDALDCLLDMIDHDPHANDTLHALTAWQHEIGQRYASLPADRKQTLLQRMDAMTPSTMHIAWPPLRRIVETI